MGYQGSETKTVEGSEAQQAVTRGRLLTSEPHSVGRDKPGALLAPLQVPGVGMGVTGQGDAHLGREGGSHPGVPWPNNSQLDQGAPSPSLSLLASSATVGLVKKFAPTFLLL